LNTNTNVSDCLELIESWSSIASKSFAHQLMKAADCSMLGIDAMSCFTTAQKSALGDVLEVGAYIAEQTIAMAMGVRDSATEKENY